MVWTQTISSILQQKSAGACICRVWRGAATAHLHRRARIGLDRWQQQRSLDGSAEAPWPQRETIGRAIAARAPTSEVAALRRVHQ